MKTYTITLADGPHVVGRLNAVDGLPLVLAAGFDPRDPDAYARLLPGGRGHCDMKATLEALAALLAAGLTTAEERDEHGRPRHVWTRQEVLNGMRHEQVAEYGRVAARLLLSLSRATKRQRRLTKKGTCNG